MKYGIRSISLHYGAQGDSITAAVRRFRTSGPRVMAWHQQLPSGLLIVQPRHDLGGEPLIYLYTPSTAQRQRPGLLLRPRKNRTTLPVLVAALRTSLGQ